MTYFDALTAAMIDFGQHPKALVLGQAVAVNGTTMSATFRDVPKPKLIELPVAEEMQMGMAIGLSLEGFLPLCVFPRWNFVLRAADQLVNHLDRLPIYSNGGYRPKVIIRTAVPSTSPFNPQSQHDDDFTVAFGMMLRTVNVVQLARAEEIVPAYRKAMDSERSTILVEFTHLYREARASEQR